MGVLFAWLLATGSHWDLVQAFAWGRMITTYMEDMSFTEAVAMTFQPENLCPVCRSVSKAKQQDQDPTLPSEGKNFGKVVFVYKPQSEIIPDLRGDNWPSPEDVSPRELDRLPPPVPPPRAHV